MSLPVLQRGTALKVLQGDGATPTEAFSIVCIATTKKFDEKVETDDANVIDCASPDNLPVRASVAKARTFDLQISGKADFQKFAALRANMDGNVHNYQVTRDGTGALGGGKYQGGFILTDLSIDTNENGMVGFSATLKGQGVCTFTANA